MRRLWMGEMDFFFVLSPSRDCAMRHKNGVKIISSAKCSLKQFEKKISNQKSKGNNRLKSNWILLQPTALSSFKPSEYGVYGWNAIMCPCWNKMTKNHVYVAAWSDKILKRGQVNGNQRFCKETITFSCSFGQSSIWRQTKLRWKWVKMIFD